MFYADLHIHSKHSRATSREADLEHLAWWAARKGIALVGTGDFTHPVWFDELRAKLTPAEPGLFRLRPEIEGEVLRRLPAACQTPTRFLLEVEVSTIYKKGEKTRKVHHLIYAASFETAARLRERLARIGNLASDGRPILGLDSRHLLEITLESGPDAYLIPAHVWTPWFAALGSKSGFDSIAECYGDLAPHIFAVETGLSSDPPMNWRVGGLDRFTLVSNSDAHSPPMVGREATAFATELDYFALRRALETGAGFGGTVEFFPEEGKYHLDGHRACGVRLEPEETRARGGACPACGKPLTVGVMHRVEELADRPEGFVREGQAPFRSLVPLPEVLAELHGVGTKSRAVERAAEGLVERLGPELAILERVPLEDVRRAGEPLLCEALERLRAGRVRREAGYDGEYGVIRLFDEGEIAARGASGLLFALGKAPPGPAKAAAPRVPASPPPVEQQRARPAAHPPEPGQGLLAGLDPDQRRAAEITAGPLLILAGPGTGKTRTLTHRIAHLVAERGVDPAHHLALTFSRRAKAELAGRLGELLGERAERITTSTFHGLGLAVLTELAPSLGLPARPRLIDPGSQAALAAELFAGKPKEAERRLAEARAERRRLALEGGPEESAAQRDLRSYLEALRERELFDFDDLLLLPIAALEADHALAARLRERWPWISIDEYQDIDAMQYRLVRLLTTPESHLSAIGDPDQAIYGFRGADVRHFLHFREDYPGARVVELARNYRSSEIIVAAASQAIRPGSLAPGRRFVAAAALAPERLVIHGAPTERAEAEWVVATIEDLLGGTSYFSLDTKRSDGLAGDGLAVSDFAVLYRTEAQAAPLIEALGRAGIPFRKYSHHPLAEEPGVAALAKALASAPAAEGAATVEARLDRAAERATSGASPAEAAILLAAAELLRPLAAACGDDRERFLAEVALGEEIDTFDPRAERVALLTLHAAKGLEFPVVFLVGCEDGLLPLAFGGAPPENPAEERRLFFVGVTRAERRLFLSHTAKRRLLGTTREAAPSPFLRDIAEELIDRRRGEEGERKPVQLRLL